mgnify:CR=1 FL=1
MEKERAMFSLIELWEQSKESQSNFCANHGVSLSKFGYWRNKWLASRASSEEAQSSSFIPILAEQSQHSPSVDPASGYEIIYSNGVRLRLPHLDLSVLPQLLSLDV